MVWGQGPTVTWGVKTQLMSVKECFFIKIQNFVVHNCHGFKFKPRFLGSSWSQITFFNIHPLRSSNKNSVLNCFGRVKNVQ